MFVVKCLNLELAPVGPACPKNVVFYYDIYMSFLTELTKITVS